MSNPPFIPPSLDTRLQMALAEDIESGDITCEAVFGSDKREAEPARAVIRAKQDGVLSGVEVAKRVFELLAEWRKGKIEIDLLLPDGSTVRPGDEAMRLQGPADLLLMGERTALNIMQRMSGVATLTRRCVEAAAGGFQVVDTRKTTPLWRDLQKAAVVHGGGANHRMGLYDAYMIKDNHIDAAGGLTEAVRRVLAHREKSRQSFIHRMGRDATPFDPEIVVEIRTLEELREALAVVPTSAYLMLDNMRGDKLREALEIMRGKARSEISGGVDIDDLPAFLDLGIDRISLGCLTHSAPALDLSMTIDLKI